MNDDRVSLCAISDCTGCFACEGVCPKKAISKELDLEGFYYPKIDSSRCILCHACEKVCPVLNPVKKFNEGEVYASWIKDSLIRKSSSSGGIFSAFAHSIFEQGGVVVGAELCDDNYVHHKLVVSYNDLWRLRGSKYVQSLIDIDCYNQIRSFLSRGIKVLFTGTPCQVAGIKSLFKNYSNLLYTIDLVCHGVPAPLFFAKLLFDIRQHTPNFISYSFRDTENWTVSPSVKVTKKGRVIQKQVYGSYSLYQDAFLKGYLHRNCCYTCRYCTRSRVGDITLADFWGIGKSIPFEGDVSSGCSMVSINSDKGQELFESIKICIEYYQREIEETIVGGNEQLESPTIYPEERKSFYKDALSLSYKQLIKKYKLVIQYDPNSIIGLIKRVYSRIRRII